VWAMRAVLIAMVVFALLGLVSTFVIESGYNSRLERVQIVKIDHSAMSQFGPVTVDVGDPVSLIVEDPKAVLKNKTSEGLPMVDGDYLKQHEGASMRIEPIQSVTAFARFGCAASALLAVVGLGILKRLQNPPILPIDPE
jgi:hypothetical protein